MNRERLGELLERFRRGELAESTLVETLIQLPFRELGDARVDTQRGLRQGVPEIVLGAGKTADQIVRISRALLDEKSGVLVTRVSSELAREVRDAVPGLVYEPTPRLLISDPPPESPPGSGTIAVVSAGTSDTAVAEEAARVAELLGNEVVRLYDVGVAGLHRLLAVLDPLRSARCVIAVAGMEAALASVVGGLVERPVIAVPTSQGYGAAFEGLAALLGMLNSCSSNVSVVNIDNGFGAAFVASRINH